MRRTMLRTFVIAATGLVLAGCATRSQTTGQAASMGDLGPAKLSLGAGDALGTAVYVNDLIIAMGEIPEDLRVTTMPAEGLSLGE